MRDQLQARFREAMPACDYATLRWVRDRDDIMAVRRDVLQPVHASTDEGAMITVVHDGGMGYAATSDLSVSGLRAAADRALDWAKRTAGRSVVDFARVPRMTAEAEYSTPVKSPWAQTPLSDKVSLLTEECARLKVDDRVVDWGASLWSTEVETILLSTEGGCVHQNFAMVVPGMHATANEGTETQTRTLGGHAAAQQGGIEVLDAMGFREAAPRIGAEAVELLEAPDCPSGTMDIILAPDQMVLQIHESIGHPLELDRILGDERNYAGTSFVTTDMFGSYQYGSELLNVAFDPSKAEQLATYGYDDEGAPAKKEFLIEKGILKRGLGGQTSQVRLGLEGVANARACNWNRPPIDRMANINLEPGDSSFEDLVSKVEKGVFLTTNCSWSIDDSRNKFQFGCERGTLIENGELKGTVRKPNYRGISATFWRSLDGVGRADTLEVLGTPNCGKGEPNQVIRVGHASPPCLFRNVDVFGGA
jgi:predicted Zn-dependent protease